MCLHGQANELAAINKFAYIYIYIYAKIGWTSYLILSKGKRNKNHRKGMHNI